MRIRTDLQYGLRRLDKEDVCHISTVCLTGLYSRVTASNSDLMFRLTLTNHILL